MLVRSLYREGIALKNDYVGPIGAINLRFLSSSPQQIQNYLTLVNPFDGFVWAFLLASVVAVISSLIIIDTFYADWTKTSKKDIIYQSIYILVFKRNLGHMKLFFSGIFITIGLIIEEDILDKYFRKQPCAKARELLVLKWSMMGFLLTMCYKQILLSTLIHIEYEKGLDSIEDVIMSNKPVTYDGTSGIASLLKNDPRDHVKEIIRRQKPYVSEKGIAPLWVSEGYS